MRRLISIKLNDVNLGLCPYLNYNSLLSITYFTFIPQLYGMSVIIVG